MRSENTMTIFIYLVGKVKICPDSLITHFGKIYLLVKFKAELAEGYLSLNGDGMNSKTGLNLGFSCFLQLFAGPSLLQVLPEFLYALQVRWVPSYA